jgi:hypothetical protein
MGGARHHLRPRGALPDDGAHAGRDNFVGISFTTIDMWVVFDQLWPITTSTLMTRMLGSILRDTSELLFLMDSDLDHTTRVIRARTLRSEKRSRSSARRMSSFRMNSDRSGRARPSGAVGS